MRKLMIAGRRQRLGGDSTLRPARWSGRLGVRPLLRAGLVATLLMLAAAVLYAPPAEPSCPPTVGAPDTGRPDPTSGGTPGPLALPAGSVGVPVRLAEPAALAVVRPGARVDLLAVPVTAVGTAAGEPALLASRALVLDVVGADAGDDSAALYLALRPDQAQQTVSQPPGSRFAIVVRG